MTEHDATVLNEDQRDALQELSNIGMGHAGASIAKIWGEFVNLSVPRIAQIDRVNISPLLQRMVGDERINVVRQAFHGQLRGEVLVVFTGGRSSLLAELMGYESADCVEEQELLLDIANILVGACLGCVADALGVDIGFSAPSVMGVDIPISALVMQPNEAVAGRALFIEVRFALENKAFSSHLIVLMPSDEVGALAQALDKFIESL